MYHGQVVHGIRRRIVHGNVIQDIIDIIMQVVRLVQHDIIVHETKVEMIVQYEVIVRNEVLGR